jgi:hypothetical protein
MPEEQTSLQEAMQRIMGAPAGGAAQAPPMADEMAPRTPYSADLANFMPTTTLDLRNTPFDPFAEQNAELEAMKAQTSALQTQLQQQVASSPSSLPSTQPWTPPLLQPSAAAQREAQAPAPAPQAPPHVTQAWEYHAPGPVQGSVGTIYKQPPMAIYKPPPMAIQPAPQVRR